MGNSHRIDSSNNGADKDLIRAWHRYIDIVHHLKGSIWLLYNGCFHGWDSRAFGYFLFFFCRDFKDVTAGRSRCWLGIRRNRGTELKGGIICPSFLYPNSPTSSRPAPKCRVKQASARTKSMVLYLDAMIRHGPGHGRLIRSLSRPQGALVVVYLA